MISFDDFDQPIVLLQNITTSKINQKYSLVTIKQSKNTKMIIKNIQCFYLNFGLLDIATDSLEIYNSKIQIQNFGLETSGNSLITSSDINGITIKSCYFEGEFELISGAVFIHTFLALLKYFKYIFLGFIFAKSDK